MRALSIICVVVALQKLPVYGAPMVPDRASKATFRQVQQTPKPVRTGKVHIAAQNRVPSILRALRARPIPSVGGRTPRKSVWKETKKVL